MLVHRALRRGVAVVASLCILAFQLPAKDTLRLHWEDVGPLVGGKRVSLTLKSSVRLTGTVHEVNAAGIRIDVTRTSDRNAYQKGLVEIPRSLVSTVEVHKRTAHKGLIIGGAVGGGISALAGGILGAQTANEGGIAAGGILAAAIVAPIAIGLLIGQLFDSIAPRSEKKIAILND